MSLVTLSWFEFPAGDKTPKGSFWIAIKTPYDPVFVNNLKERYPKKDRFWYQKNSCWMLNPEMRFDLISILRENNYDTICEGPETPPSKYCPPTKPCPPKEKNVLDHEILQISPFAYIEVAKAAYKALSRLYHPDLPTGDIDKMKNLNTAWDRLSKRYKRR